MKAPACHLMHCVACAMKTLQYWLVTCYERMDISKPCLSEAQREILEKAYADGLISTAEKFADIFDELSAKTDLPKSKIKVWINNRKRRERKRAPQDHAENSGTTHVSSVGKAKFFRKVSGHNVFCASLWSGGRYFTVKILLDCLQGFWRLLWFRPT